MTETTSQLELRAIHARRPSDGPRPSVGALCGADHRHGVATTLVADHVTCVRCRALLPRQSGRDYSQPPDPFMLRAADRLYDECERALREGRIDARSLIGDATLDYRDMRWPDGDTDA